MFITKPLADLANWATHPQKKRVYAFNEGTIEDKILLGNKGANLCEMTRLGLPVPPGFVITTETCLDYFKSNKVIPDSLIGEYTRAVHEIERKSGEIFGNKESTAFPLLLSVRSGAAVSMPGMMDTVLNLGINDEIADAMIKFTKNQRFVYDTYRRFLQMFGTVVLGIDHCRFEEHIITLKEARGIKNDCDLNAIDLKKLVSIFKDIADVPENPWEQLKMAVAAVFSSWYSPRAMKYRSVHNIPDNLGTAVNIQAMVFGNMNRNSGTGVAFTRNPGTGENLFYGEYLVNAEGEDVVAGVRTPMSLEDLHIQQPHVYGLLVYYQKKLETHYKDMQDIEFTVEDGVLFILQTRTGKRTAKASVKIAVDMVQERLITEREALMRIEAEKMTFFLHRMIDPAAEKVSKGQHIAQGLPASAGAATGLAVFTCEDAETFSKEGHNVILIRQETSADDIGGLKAATGILTVHGGMTSHAAVVARGMGKCAITGAGMSEITVNITAQTMTCKSKRIIRRGDVITLDGTSGFVYEGNVPTIPAERDEDYQKVLQWADRFKRMHVLANAETPEDVKKAVEFGADGIGLCRTEHMFFHPDRIDTMRAMILSQSIEERNKYLDILEKFQLKDFEEVFRLLPNQQVCIRLLDPPLHEFLPKLEEEVLGLADRLKMDRLLCKSRVEFLHESNPMLGFRGCRISVVHPEITTMQTKAIIRAALKVQSEGMIVKPEIMIPLVCTDHEVEFISPIIHAAALKVFEETGQSIHYRLGTMLEVPRACIRASAIATEGNIEFVSFGSNDLTQMIFGFSRDDAEKFLPSYLENHILANDPFVTLDERGVGAMIKSTLQECRKVNNNLIAGVCGEHGGDPNSIQYFDKIGIDYVSCSPFRVQIAKIAAAQAHIKAISETSMLMKNFPRHAIVILNEDDLAQEIFNRAIFF